MIRLIFLFLIVMVSCSNKKELIECKRLAIKPDSDGYIFYNLYRTGFDNYTYDLKIFSLKDSTERHIMNLYLNDASAENVQLSSLTISDTVKIYFNRNLIFNDKKINNLPIKLTLTSILTDDNNRLPGVLAGDVRLDDPDNWDSLLMKMNFEK